MNQWKMSLLVAAVFSMTSVAANAQAHKIKIKWNTSVNCYWIVGEEGAGSKVMDGGPKGFNAVTPRDGWIDTPYIVKNGGPLTVHRLSGNKCDNSATLVDVYTGKGPGNDGLANFWVKDFVKKGTKTPE